MSTEVSIPLICFSFAVSATEVYIKCFFIAFSDSQYNLLETLHSHPLKSIIPPNTVSKQPFGFALLQTLKLQWCTGLEPNVTGWKPFKVFSFSPVSLYNIFSKSSWISRMFFANLKLFCFCFGFILKLSRKPFLPSLFLYCRNHEYCFQFRQVRPTFPALGSLVTSWMGCLSCVAQSIL